MEVKELMVTIPLETYDELKKGEFILDEIDDLANECIKNAEVNSWDKECLQVKEADLKRLLRYINVNGYDKKLKEEQ